MAVHADPDVTVPVSTGAVTTPGAFTVEQPADNTSTGTVSPNGEPVETRFGPSGQRPTGQVETPGPVTIEGWTAKVVKPRERREPRTSTAEIKQQQARPQQERARYSDEFEGR